ncbi:MAG: hypothetical protein A2X27_08715 [Chloroflexi bacterium GWD2_49_16]|nr:MAG: hypothetical protein A2X26_03980 [Chloroflexi bacterium GWC2_49_37]OGN82990.1 MAG: hypothetical protein A2X27_08715 [Chloroflexi bacterium GWD2_49_16]
MITIPAADTCKKISFVLSQFNFYEYLNKYYTNVIRIVKELLYLTLKVSPANLQYPPHGRSAN